MKRHQAGGAVIMARQRQVDSSLLLIAHTIMLGDQSKSSLVSPPMKTIINGKCYAA